MQIRSHLCDRENHKRSVSGTSGARRLSKRMPVSRFSLQRRVIWICFQSLPLIVPKAILELFFPLSPDFPPSSHFSTTGFFLHPSMSFAPTPSLNKKTTWKSGRLLKEDTRFSKSPKEHEKNSHTRSEIAGCPDCKRDNWERSRTRNEGKRRLDPISVFPCWHDDGCRWLLRYYEDCYFSEPMKRHGLVQLRSATRNL